jgi:hypothetical protein
VTKMGSQILSASDIDATTTASSSTPSISSSSTGMTCGGTARSAPDYASEPAPPRRGRPSLQRASCRRGRPPRVRARLQDGTGRHRLEAPRLVLSLWTLTGLDQEQEPERACGEAGSRRGLGPLNGQCKARRRPVGALGGWGDEGVRYLIAGAASLRLVAKAEPGRTRKFPFSGSA